MKFLQDDTVLTRALSRFIEIVLANALWLIGSLPVFTAGASTTALYTVTLSMAEGDGQGIISTFFASYKKNFLRSTAVFFALLFAGVFLAADLWSAAHWDVPFQFILEILILSAGYFYLLIASHAFAGLAYFSGSPFHVLKKVFGLAVRNGIYTVFVMVLSVFPFLFLAKQFASVYFGQWLILFLLFGNGLIAYLNSLHLARLFASDAQRGAGA